MTAAPSPLPTYSEARVKAGVAGKVTIKLQAPLTAEPTVGWPHGLDTPGVEWEASAPALVHVLHRH